MSDNSTPLTPQQKFEDKIKDRLRGDIGDLIPDEVLQEMIKKSIDDFFFKDTQRLDSYGRPSGEKQPGWFHQQIAKKLDKQLNKWVDRYIRKQGPALFEAMEKQFVELAPRIILQKFTNKIMFEGAQLPMSKIFEVEANLMNKRY